MSPCLCSYRGTWLRTEIPTAGVRSSTGKQECSTFPQRGFQHGSESLHMHCTYSTSLSKRQYAETSQSSTGAYLCVTLGLRINGKAYRTLLHMLVQSSVWTLHTQILAGRSEMSSPLQKHCRTEMHHTWKPIKLLIWEDEKKHCVSWSQQQNTHRGPQSLKHNVPEESYEGPTVCHLRRHAYYSTITLWHS